MTNLIKFNDAIELYDQLYKTDLTITIKEGNEIKTLHCMPLRLKPNEKILQENSFKNNGLIVVRYYSKITETIEYESFYFNDIISVCISDEQYGLIT